MALVYHALLRARIIQTLLSTGEGNCCHCGQSHEVQVCTKFCQQLQLLMDQRLVEFGIEGMSQTVNMAGEEPFVVYYNEEVKFKPCMIHYTEKAPNDPLIIMMPSPFKYQDDHRVPWKYECSFSSSEYDIGGVTRSGKVYAPKNIEKTDDRHRVEVEKEWRNGEFSEVTNSAKFLK